MHSQAQDAYSIMKTRATLTIDPELHARAKRIAKRRKTTVSGLFESFLRREPDPEGSLVDGMIGSAVLRQSRPGSDPRMERLKKKYLT